MCIGGRGGGGGIGGAKCHKLTFNFVVVSPSHRALSRTALISVMSDVSALKSHGVACPSGRHINYVHVDEYCVLERLVSLAELKAQKTLSMALSHDATIRVNANTQLHAPQTNKELCNLLLPSRVCSDVTARVGTES